MDFLKQHKPPARNALTLLAEARSEAKRSGRRVWVIQGGPRCGPCFRLARWIEDHHATLDKDYVVVKLMDGIDEHVTEALAGLPIKEGDGIPWFAITEPDGNVLAVSRGPMGNIGFPSFRGGNPSLSADARSNRSEDDFRRSGSTHQLAFIGQVRRSPSHSPVSLVSDTIDQK